ncbi:MAG: hypothetical protein A3D59_03615 [Candidatus Wildermuthbacteria bacterium RIFCSPHIGHO2_02_FULL_47_17]|uniref:UDP-N-acetylglucosamine--N-acetylmuramyl-(pentapeptide) pyrophosphoryl-undecaprenol N-acetylglucosamine transferase n=1 Tax=Candidatus Wildermuthbacteria bacterium RIFCSPHIGHO2_02_FULL_47_17 TaxID=1802452 RepID=A0A1G2R5G1_9BACT|nr:MAG: hypothetical protein A3D59_03615 [Candidatus Wildermuthbacteria bacterium RIFCSPHIGHO2_02_FULL_47_17]
MKILFTGGGTGGHIVPIIGIAREMKLLYPNSDLKFFYIGPRDSFGAMLLAQEGIKVRSIFAGKIRRNLDWKTVLQNALDLLVKIPLGIFQSFWYIFFIGPDLVLSKGGYGSFPVVFSAWVLQTPIFLHESDVAPGLANRISGKMAVEIFVSFPKTEYFAVQKSIIVGNPIRREILGGSAEEGRAKLHLTGKRPVMLVLGGSQGAQRINDVILAALPELLVDFEIIHQTGDQNFSAVQAEAEVIMPRGYEGFYHPVSFLREVDLRDAYSACDIVVARSGAGTIFETAAVGKPSILVPLPEAAQNHQYKNAYAYGSHGAAIVMEEPNFLPHFFVERLTYLFSHQDELEKMAKAARTFASPKAGQIIAEYVWGYLMQ